MGRGKSGIGRLIESFVYRRITDPTLWSRPFCTLRIKATFGQFPKVALQIGRYDVIAIAAFSGTEENW